MFIVLPQKLLCWAQTMLTWRWGPDVTILCKLHRYCHTYPQSDYKYLCYLLIDFQLFRSNFRKCRARSIIYYLSLNCLPKGSYFHCSNFILHTVYIKRPDEFRLEHCFNKSIEYINTLCSLMENLPNRNKRLGAAKFNRCCWFQCSVVQHSAEWLSKLFVWSLHVVFVHV